MKIDRNKTQQKKYVYIVCSEICIVYYPVTFYFLTINYYYYFILADSIKFCLCF